MSCLACGSENVKEVYVLNVHRHPMLDQIYKKDILKQCQDCKTIWVGS